MKKSKVDTVIIALCLTLVCNLMIVVSKLKQTQRTLEELQELNDELQARLTYSEQALKAQTGETDFYKNLVKGETNDSN